MLNKSFVHLVSLVILNCLGAGLIMTPPRLANLGLSAFFAWLITGLGTFAIGMIFVKLGEDYKGGNYYLQDIISNQFPDKFKKFVRYSCFWQYWLFGILGNAYISCAFVETLQQIFPAFAKGWSVLIHVALFTFFYVTNRFGIQLSRRITNILSLIKLGILVALPIIGCFILKNDLPIQITTNPLSDTIKGIFITVWTFLGLESISMESNVDLKMVRPAMLTGLGVCLVTVIVNSYVMMRNIPELANSSSVYVDLFALMFGGNFKWIAVSGLLLVILGSLHGWTSTNVSVADSGNDIIPDFMQKKNKYDVKEKSLIFVSVLPVLFILFTQFILRSEKLFYSIVDIATNMCLFVYFAAVIGFTLRFLTSKYNSKRKKMVDLLCIILASLFLMVAFIGAPLKEILFAILIFGIFGAMYYNYEKLQTK